MIASRHQSDPPSKAETLPGRGEQYVPSGRTGLLVDRYDVMPFAGLGEDDRQRWEQLRGTQPEFRTPFFSTVFADSVQASRGDVLVAVGYRDNEAVAFLPFHRVGRVAVPVGRYFNDAHNVIADPSTVIHWPSLLAACEVRAYDFHALVGARCQASEYDCRGTIESFRAEMGGDSPAYLRQLESSHRTIRKQQQKTRKMEREIGPLRLELDCQDRDLVHKTIEAKRQQYRRTNILDLFAPQWTRSLLIQLHQLAARPSESTRGMLSVLYAGDHVVASHFGMVERGLLHYWFPTYDVDYARYSPGTALFKEIVRASTENGIDCIDMGYGEQPYKRKQTDIVTTVEYGCITESMFHRRWKRVAGAAAGALKKAPMKRQLKQMLRRIQPNAGISRLN